MRRGAPAVLLAITILAFASDRVRTDTQRTARPPAVAAAASDPSRDLGPDAEERLKAVLTAVFAFREAALTDYRKALSQYATEEACKISAAS